jgi:hypothetical protein
MSDVKEKFKREVAGILIGQMKMENTRAGMFAGYPKGLFTGQQFNEMLDKIIELCLKEGIILDLPAILFFALKSAWSSQSAADRAEKIRDYMAGLDAEEQERMLKKKITAILRNNSDLKGFDGSGSMTYDQRRLAQGQVGELWEEGAVSFDDTIALMKVIHASKGGLQALTQKIIDSLKSKR